MGYRNMDELVEFLSTPSVGRATLFQEFDIMAVSISIHALRGEGDRRASAIASGAWKFLSTPSVGRATVVYVLYEATSIIFLSTPSVGRATTWQGSTGRCS